MPKQTFLNLAENKREKLLKAFLLEFSTKSFEDASLSAVVKKLGIAKGSVYQYFEDKMDLFFYLKQHCEQVKQSYAKHIKRENYEDFWQFLRALYQEGIKYDMERPLESNFLFALVNQQHSPTMRQFYIEWQQKALDMFTQMIAYEVEIGHFRQDLPTKSMAYVLVTLTSKIGDYMTATMGVDIQQKLFSGEPILAHNNGQTLLKAVDEHIMILKRAFSKP